MSLRGGRAGGRKERRGGDGLSRGALKVRGRWVRQEALGAGG